MGELLTFDKYWDTSYSNSISYIPSEKSRLHIKEEPATYLTAQRTAATADVWHWDELFFAFQQMVARTQEPSELDIPDIFTLRPLATQQITLQITAVKPARFYYVPDMDDGDEE
jgi:hypothetical protein